MTNKIFLLLLSVTFLLKVANCENICDNLLLDYRIGIDIGDHKISTQNEYYFSLNDGVKQMFTERQLDINENQFIVPRLDLSEGENKVAIFLDGAELLIKMLNYFPPKINIEVLNDLEVVGDNIYVSKGNNKIAIIAHEILENCDRGEGDVKQVNVFLNNDSDPVLVIKEDEIANGIEFLIEELEGGANQIKFEIVGNFDSDILDIVPDYKEISIKYLDVFYVDMELPAEFVDSTTCLSNRNIRLIGIPVGGYFVGEGITGKTDIFNPENAGEGTHLLQYVYNLNERRIQSNPINVIVTSDLEFSIVGQQIVCINSTCVDYTLDGFELEKLNFFWNVEGGSIISEDEEEVFIEWGSNVPSGKITVKGFAIDGQCYSEKELIVYIKDTLAPPKSYPVFVDKEKKLLACTDVNANIYRWIKVLNGNQIELGETNKPYIIHEAGAQSGEIFYVETAYRKEFCFTRSFPCDFANTWNSDKCSLIKSTLLPNSFIDNTEIEISQSIITIKPGTNQKYLLQVFDLAGRIQYKTSFRGEKQVRKNLFDRGTYIFLVESKGELVTKKVIGL